MNPITANLRTQIEKQTTREDAELLIAYLMGHPDCLPENNELLRECVNDSNYADRGMHGPLGGKGGTVSQIWLEEWKQINAGGPSELSLMTIIAPPENDVASEN